MCVGWEEDLDDEDDFKWILCPDLGDVQGFTVSQSHMCLFFKLFAVLS